ncbi:hypothetical protein L228DRAFT_279641 [Xylona heveae TC161]|uniref:Cation/H+ exchanger transmembrane domain-containing protein n=1 Tax=Xylona heveae (strain CBS 132557 / TC161) TaxID=1328760 RepID=A0A165JN37_XYLHT|nr:hypothetical protein L228DRAFT_279641 [Xylona heveae TC161]KZF26439.1 hypothetical protein L228DRAFT_279641 [Xylona heveae TC161]
MTSQAPSATYLPYNEPEIVTILIQSSFLLLLNLVNHVLDRLIYCGLVGQVFIGIAWGTPGAKWLDTAAEEAFMQVGYLGLILLVYEGGLSTSYSALRKDLLLSVGVAATGVALPIGLSYSLQGIAGASKLESFAAGAALCSTSLGTTFTVLSTSGLASTRLGVVLSSAAMLDDIVGLVMAQLISNMHGSTFSLSPITIVRPILVFIGLIIALLLACRFVILPATRGLNALRRRSPNGNLQWALSRKETAILMHILVLVGLIAGATCAGTSNLLAAYLAGASLSWWDTDVEHSTMKEESLASLNSSQNGNREPARAELTVVNSTNTQTSEQNPTSREERDIGNASESINGTSSRTSGVEIYHDYFSAAVQRILKPLFFASIGFSIPISQLFSPRIIWRGIVYAILMTLGKLACGLWLVRVHSGFLHGIPSFSLACSSSIARSCLSSVRSCIRTSSCHLQHLLSPRRIFSSVSEKSQREDETTTNSKPATNTDAGTPAGTGADTDTSMDNPMSSQEDVNTSRATPTPSMSATATTDPTMLPSQHAPPPARSVSASASASPSSPAPGGEPRPPQPRSLYPATILGTAMTVRGEIGLLVSSLGRSRGVLSQNVYLLATWAILICTIAGAVSVGLLVRRVKRLQLERCRTVRGVVTAHTDAAATDGEGTQARGGAGQTGQHDHSDGDDNRDPGDPLGAWGVF